jgi:hypothetical protein
MNTPIGTSRGSIERHRRAARLPLMVDTLINQRDEKIAECKLLLPQHPTCMAQPQTVIKVHCVPLWAMRSSASLDALRVTRQQRRSRFQDNASDLAQIVPAPSEYDVRIDATLMS